MTNNWKENAYALWSELSSTVDEIPLLFRRSTMRDLRVKSFFGNTSWRNLPGAQSVGPAGTYYQFKAINGSPAHLLVWDLNSLQETVIPFVSQVNKPASAVAKSAAASAAVNGGYFSMGGSVGYVIANGRIIADPTNNHGLMTDPNLKPYLEQILNRSEIRFLRKPGSKALLAQVAAHGDALPDGLTLMHSLQAGPSLLPFVRDREEAFVRTGKDGKVIDSISSNGNRPRTAVGVTADGHLLVLCVSGREDNQRSSGITLRQLAKEMRTLGCVQALNLDGGSSTTMFVRFAAKDGSHSFGRLVCSKTPEAAVKSVLLFGPRKR